VTLPGRTGAAGRFGSDVVVPTSYPFVLVDDVDDVDDPPDCEYAPPEPPSDEDPPPPQAASSRANRPAAHTLLGNLITSVSNLSLF
jgi:hypothetical protein